jgi:hypothetical protein
MHSRLWKHSCIQPGNSSAWNPTARSQARTASHGEMVADLVMSCRLQPLSGPARQSQTAEPSKSQGHGSSSLVCIDRPIRKPMGSARRTSAPRCSGLPLHNRLSIRLSIRFADTSRSRLGTSYRTGPSRWDLILPPAS